MTASTPGDGELDVLNMLAELADAAVLDREHREADPAQLRRWEDAIEAEVRKLRHDEVEWKRLHDQLDQLRAELASRPVPRMPDEVLRLRAEVNALMPVYTAACAFYDMTVDSYHDKIVDAFTGAVEAARASSPWYRPPSPGDGS